MIFLSIIFSPNKDCGYSFEAPQIGGTNELGNSGVWDISKKIISTFHLKHNISDVMKDIIILNMYIILMQSFA